MLRVTVNKNDSVEMWELEGKLSGDWVKELERCWKESTPQPGLKVQVHLKAVSYIDAAGKQLLAEMHQHGVEIKGCGCMARAVVEEIVRDATATGSPVSPKKILAVILFGVCVLGSNASLAAREKLQSDRQAFMPPGHVEPVPVDYSISRSRTPDAQTEALEH